MTNHLVAAVGGKPPVIVTCREVENLLSRKEAQESLAEAAHRDMQSTAVEKAAAMAAIGHALDEIRRAEATAGAQVLSTPHDGPASRLQSLIASGEAADLKLVPLATGGMEAKFDTGDWSGWASVAWEKLKHPFAHAMLCPRTATPTAFPKEGRIALLGDWGTGLYGAPAIAKSVSQDPDPFALLLHLGDVYYSGTQSEVQERFLALWPSRHEALSRALNSNHEMYSGGEAYFRDTLAHFGQESSYFAFQNQHWTIVGLDVAYHDHTIDDEQVAWLRKVLDQAGDRKVVLFSHHQLFSQFETAQGTKLWSHPGFGEILRKKRIFAWYWGHEHRCCLYEAPDQRFGLWGRCIGHSGMPQSRDPTRNLPRALGEPYERADWRRSSARAIGGNVLPSVLVLEGPNMHIKGEEEKFSPHGYAVLTLEGPRLTEEILDASGRVIFSQRLAG